MIRPRHRQQAASRSGVIFTMAPLPCAWACSFAICLSSLHVSRIA
jgi:hypothetical protein